MKSKKKVFMRNQHYYYFDLLKIKVGRARTTKNKVVFALNMNLPEATSTWEIYSKNNQHK